MLSACTIMRIHFDVLKFKRTKPSSNHILRPHIAPVPLEDMLHKKLFVNII